MKYLHLMGTYFIKVYYNILLFKELRYVYFAVKLMYIIKTEYNYYECHRQVNVFENYN